MSPGPEQPRRQGPRPPRPSEAAASVGGRRPGRRAVRPLLQNPPEWRGGAAHPHPLVPAGGGGAGGEARALPVGQEGRAGAHVHQHQQRALHPPGRVHLGRQGRQLLRVPAEAVDPGREDGDAVRPAPLPRGPSARAGHGGLPRPGLGASVGGLSPHGLRAEAGPGRTPGAARGPRQAGPGLPWGPAPGGGRAAGKVRASSAQHPAARPARCPGKQRGSSRSGLEQADEPS